MTKKERAIAAIRFKRIDRIPSSYRGLQNLSVRLNRYFGFKQPGNLVANYKNLINALGADFYSSGSKICKFSTFTPAFNGPVPVKPYVRDHAGYYQLGANSIAGKGGSGDQIMEYDVISNPPLAGFSNASEIRPGFLTSRLKYFDFSKFENKYGSKAQTYSNLKNSEEEFICIGSLSHLFMICWVLRGYEQFLMDLAFNIKLARKLINEVCDFALEFNRRELESFGSWAEYYGTADDVAGQYGMLISPQVFKKYFLPSYKKLISNVKRKGIIFSWHCCGSVHKVLPMMIDAGIDVFDVVQTSARDMDIGNIYKLYGKDVCLHGAIDVQNLLVLKPAREVREEVKKIKNLWSNKGGIIVAPSHESPPETPIENIVALYQELNG